LQEILRLRQQLAQFQSPRRDLDALVRSGIPPAHTRKESLPSMQPLRRESNFGAAVPRDGPLPGMHQIIEYSTLTNLSLHIL